MTNVTKRGVTLIELIVVLVIVSILSTIAVGVYTKEILRARIARTRAEINTIEIAINRYHIDMGQYPPTGTGTDLPPNPLNPTAPYEGCGYLQLALRSSLSGTSVPLSDRWQGPYLEWEENRLGTLTGVPITATTTVQEIQLLDPWENPYYYVKNDDYLSFQATHLPGDSPFAATEVFYNVSTYQIISFGPNGTTNFATTPLRTNLGTEADDITNWEASLF